MSPVYFKYTLVLIFYGIGARFLSVIFELFLSGFLLDGDSEVNLRV